MSRVVIIGDVPELVTLMIRASNAVSRLDGADAAIDSESVDWALVAYRGSDDLTIMDRLTAAEIPFAVWSPRVDQDQVLAFLSRPVEAVIEGEKPDHRAVSLAASRMTTLVTAKAMVPGSGDLALGSYFAIDTSDHRDVVHRSGAVTSMISASTQHLLRTMRSAIAAMDRQPVPAMGWDPHRRGLTPKVPQGRKGPKPSLDDLYLGVSETTTRAIGWFEADERRRQYAKPPSMLIRGESGSGKSLVADLMWRSFAASPQWQANAGTPMPFVTINCGGLTTTNFDHVMVGSAPKVWSDIDRPVVGLLPQADFGVAFFDELGDLDPTAQSRLKVFFDDHVVHPTGLAPYYLHLRVIAATNVNLETSGFQHDLRQRFGYTVTVPPLNERTEEVSRLVDYFAQAPAINPLRKGTLSVTHIAADALRWLEKYDWSNGNVRELRQIVSGAVARAGRDRRQVVLREDVVVSRADKALPPGRVVRVAERLDLSGAVLIKTAADLDRLAVLSGAPVLRDEAGQSLVRTTTGTFAHHPTQEN